jgi:hypothetical protein
MGPVGPCKPSQRREGHTEAMWGPPESGDCQGLRVVYTALGAAILRLQCGAAVGAVFSGLYLSSAVGSLGLPPDLLARLPAPGLVAGCRPSGYTVWQEPRAARSGRPRTEGPTGVRLRLWSAGEYDSRELCSTEAKQAACWL